MSSIEDGTGTGRKAKVDKENKLHVMATTQTAEREANITHGEAYCAVFAVNPDGAGDCFLYLKNQDEKDLILERVWLSVSGADEVYLEIGATGTAVKTNGADVVPVNLNSGSGKTADVLCYSNAADGAVDITGLSGGSIFNKLWIVAAADTKPFDFEEDIVLKKNGTFSMWCVGGDVLIRGTVVFHFHDNS